MITCRKCGEVKPRAKRDWAVCRECLTQYNREYRAANPTHARDWTRQYRAKNRAHCRKTNREWQRKRRDEPVARICDNIAASVSKAFQRHGAGKFLRTMEIIGSDPRDIAEWARTHGHNPPRTQIDHIVPVSWWLANFPLKEALRKAWRLSNLRVIPAKENLQKGARRAFLC